MARRSSRLSSRNSSTPQPVKRVSLSHETPSARVPRTVPAKLAALDENDEMPGAFPGSPNEQETPTVPSKRAKTVEPPKDATPKTSAPPEAPTEEMHPKLLHQSTAKPRDEARWLGFSNMPPATEPPKRNNKLAEVQATPSRTTKEEHAFKSPEFPFTFRREQSLELSPEAKKLMGEKRAEALRIKGQMKSAGEIAQSSGNALDRKFAQPKSKKSRFSELHEAQFNKMDSIAGHASAYRKDPTRLAVAAESKVPAQTPTKSLKRSQSKADLGNTEATPSKTVPRTSSKSNLVQPPSQLRRAPSMKNLRDDTGGDGSPAKRVKRAENQDVSKSRPTSNEGDKALPTTPQHIKDARAQPSYPNLAHLSTPTQSSLARAASVKSAKPTSKIPGPSLTQSPSKSIPVEASNASPKAATPLLAKSPSKIALLSHDNHSLPVAGKTTDNKPQPLMDASLARTPAKDGTHRPARPDQDASPSPQKKDPQAHLLSRSPLKMSVSTGKEGEEETSDKQTKVPLLSQSPSKASHDHNPFTTAVSQSAVKSTGNGLIGRFNMLRSSPIKSILRTPQRLYSNDPSKIAAGTHFATPPKFGGGAKPAGPPPATAPVRKHVDFSSSTIAREATKSATPSDDAAPPSDDEESAERKTANYPSLPSITSPVAEPTPERRRQTIAPGDFTFRAGDGIVFGPSSLAQKASNKLPSTIRHVSAEPDIVPSGVAASQKKRKFDFENKINATPAELSPTVTPGSKKRKFAFENDAVANAAEAVSTSDKENGNAAVETEDDNESRPAKRVKSAPKPAKNLPKPTAKTTASRMPTLGVKPKPKAGSSSNSGSGTSGAKDEKKKSGTSISMARLNALAMPKRRG